MPVKKCKSCQAVIKESLIFEAIRKGVESVVCPACDVSNPLTGTALDMAKHNKVAQDNEDEDSGLDISL
jgi:hypothetical protein